MPYTQLRWSAFFASLLWLALAPGTALAQSAPHAIVTIATTEGDIDALAADPADGHPVVLSRCAIDCGDVVQYVSHYTAAGTLVARVPLRQRMNRVLPLLEAMFVAGPGGLFRVAGDGSLTAMAVTTPLDDVAVPSCTTPPCPFYRDWSVGQDNAIYLLQTTRVATGDASVVMRVTADGQSRVVGTAPIAAFWLWPTGDGALITDHQTLYRLVAGSPAPVLLLQPPASMVVSAMDAEDGTVYATGIISEINPSFDRVASDGSGRAPLHWASPGTLTVSELLTRSPGIVYAIAFDSQPGCARLYRFRNGVGRPVADLPAGVCQGLILASGNGPLFGAGARTLVRIDAADAAPAPPGPSGCRMTTTLSSRSFEAAGGAGSLAITTRPDCAWTITTPDDWVTLDRTSGAGSAQVPFIVTRNATTTQRTATIAIDGAPETLVQRPAHTPIVDVDGNGSGDALLYNRSTGAWSLRLGPLMTEAVSGTWAAGWDVYPADFDRDGRTDFLLYNPANGRAATVLTVLRDDDTLGFAYVEYAWSPGWSITVADLDGDGRSDVFVYDAISGRWVRCISQPDHSFAYTNTGTWSPSWTIYPADFDADGRTDLFLYNASSDANHGRWFRVLSNPDESLTYLAGDTVWSSDWTITPGDYDGDGRTDLFLYRARGDWYRVRFTGAGPSYDAGAWSAGWTLSRGDFNGDGRTDLFLYNPTSGRWYEVIAEPDGSWSYYGGSTWAANWQVSVTDADGDGRADLLLYNPVNGRWAQAMTVAPGEFAIREGTFGPGYTIVAK
jgi:hypothetical protein